MREAPRVALEQDAVGREGEVLHVSDPDELLDKGLEVAPQEGFPAGEAHGVHALRGEHAYEALDLVERQNRLAGQPDVVHLGHAVRAPQIATIGDRDPQTAQRSAETVDPGHGATSDARSMRSR